MLFALNAPLLTATLLPMRGNFAIEAFLEGLLRSEQYSSCMECFIEKRIAGVEAPVVKACAVTTIEALHSLHVTSR